ncbi:MAG: glycosyl transferase [Rhodobacteraceae bacterium]|nr:glycosyl transferase [Paracoccaceae bacterium]
MSTYGWLFCVFAGAGLLSSAARSDAYRIGAGDVLSLRVLEWQPVEGQAVEWDALRANLTVDSEGMVTIPFLGRIKADDLSLPDLSTVVAEGLQDRLAVSASLDAVIEVATYRPVYVAGAVRTPGEYPFRPGLTVAQLVAQAGGGALGTGTLDARDMLTRDGTLRLLQLDAERLALRRAMLQAAIDGQETLTLPPRQDGSAWPADLVSSENRVLRLRNERRARELLALDDQIALLEREIEVLNERSAAMERLIDSARKENENAQSLVDRGLAATARVSETERTVALVEAQSLDVSTARLRARQGITQAEAEKLALRDRDLIEDTRELQRVEEELARAVSSLDTQQSLAIAESGLILRGGATGDDPALPEPEVTILRGQGGSAIRLTGLETPLEPGDVVSVTMPRLLGQWSDDLASQDPASGLQPAASLPADQAPPPALASQ